MASRFNPMKADARWQTVWARQRCFAAANATCDSRASGSVLEIIPCPSGPVHMGHVRQFTMRDVIARFGAMNGHALRRRIAADSFGMPAETAATRQRLAPDSLTSATADMARSQLKRLGLAFDWDQELSTFAPDHDRHEQLNDHSGWRPGLPDKRRMRRQLCRKIIGGVTHETYRIASDADDIRSGYWVSPDEIGTRGDGQLYEIATGQLVRAGRAETMSRSKRNIVEAVPILDQFGADAVRWFMLSDSPPERDLPWSEAGIEASWRFVQRLWRIFERDAAGTGDNIDAGLERALHRAIAGIGADIGGLGFNKAVASVHGFATAMEKAPASATRSAATRSLVRLIAPMMPHLAEEAWELTGGDGLVVHQPWPDHDPALLVETQIMVAVQVGGKLRDTLAVAKDASRGALEAAALASEKIIRTLDGATPKKVIVVPGRLVNIVI